MTASTMTKPSSAETAKLLKKLLSDVPREERSDAARLDELRRIFSRLVSSGDLVFGSFTKKDPSSVQQQWNSFLQKQHKSFVTQLCTKIQNSSNNSKTAIRTMWGVIASCPMLSNNGLHQHVHPELLYAWLQAMSRVERDFDKSMIHMIQDEFLTSYHDVRYYALVAIARLATDYHTKTNASDNNQDDGVFHAERLLQLLLMIPIPTSQQDMDGSNASSSNKNYLLPPPQQQQEADDSEDEESSDDEEEGAESYDEEDDSSSEAEQEETGTRTCNDAAQVKKPKQQNSFACTRYKSHCKVLFQAWLAVLKLPLPPRALKHALQFLPGNVLPKVSNPLLFADFFMQAYDNTSSTQNHNYTISMLALDGLFCLMTQHGLEYPKFYESLYQLIQPRMFYAKQKIRFLELLTKCLVRNEMIPAFLVASFCKRLLRCCMQAPPPSILFCLALVSNLLRQHEECNCLIHRSRQEQVEDVFDATTNDPFQSRALESSLWELEALGHHYYPAVSTMAKSIGTEPSNIPLHNMDDFLRHTYKGLFVQERKRGSNEKNKKRKVSTPLTFVEPKGGLFKDGDDVFDSILHVPNRKKLK